MKETKKMKFTECLSHLFVFIKPYRFKLLFGILMVITAQVTFALNPTVEGMITTQLAADISAHQPIQVDKVVHILCILFSIYIVKTISQFLMAVFMTDAIQKTMFDVRNAMRIKFIIYLFLILIKKKRESYYHVSQMMWIHYRMRCSKLYHE